MKLKKTYNYSDLEITPEITTSISSRSECNPRYNANLPLFTAPMDSIVNINNLDYWSSNSIIPIIPRNIPYDVRLKYLCTLNTWVALSYNEFKELFCVINNDIQQAYLPKDSIFRVCIDIANGHQLALLNSIRLAKSLAKENNYTLIIMSGNIANPDTYYEYCKAGVDYVRCGIGGGSGCLTSSNVGVHYGLASLILECRNIKEQLIKTGNLNYTKIIADGGIKGYRDAIIALACGADYVMIGGIFASFLESASPIIGLKYLEDGGILLNDKHISFTKEDLKVEENKRDLIKNYTLLKDFHGMSTKEAQLSINPNIVNLKTSEGKCFTQTVKYTMEQWVNNFEDYLKSAMSYTDCLTLEEFKSKVSLNLVSEGTRNRVNK